MYSSSSILAGTRARREVSGPPSAQLQAARRWRLVCALGLTLAGSWLLWFNTASIRTTNLSKMHSTWRYMDDMALASQRWLHWRGLLDESRDAPAVNLDKMARHFRQHVLSRVRRQHIQPHQFWRKVSHGRLLRALSHVEKPRFEDRGRSLMLAVAFLLVGGVAPYLELWLGVFLCFPVLAWCAFELVGAGRSIAACATVLAVANSPFVIETLSLPHSAVAFYLITALAIVALGTYALMGRSRSRAGLLARLAAVAVVLAVATMARSSTVFLLPALAWAALWATERVMLAGGWPRGSPAVRLLKHLALAAALGLMLITPYLALRPAVSHNVWISLWQGLADFGADRGYAWGDGGPKEVLQRSGIEPFVTPRHVTAEQERFFRNAVLGDIRKDPLWYASILGKRVVATAGMTRLLPWAPVDGVSLRYPLFHYRYTTPADWVCFGRRRRELPVQVFWLPPLVLAAIWWFARRRGDVESQSRLRATGKLLAVIAVGALGAPVAVSTFSGIETQVFVLVYFVAFAFAIDEVARAALRWKRRYLPATMASPIPAAGSGSSTSTL